MSRTKSTQPLRVAKLTADTTLSKAAAAEFQRIVRSVAEHHFQECDRALIQAYAEAVVNLRTAQKALDAGGLVDKNGKLNAWNIVAEKNVRAITGLALRLRLCPSARLDRATAGTSSRPQLPSWEDEDPLLRGRDDDRLNPKKLAYYRLDAKERERLAAQLADDEKYFAS